MTHTYDFDQMVDRKNTASVKWDRADALFHGQALLPMWVADMDFCVPDSITEALKNRVAHGVYGYSVRTDSYLDAVRDWMKGRHGWAVEKDWLCHSPGVVTALNLIVDGFTRPGDKILIQTPVYPPFRTSAKNQHRELITSPLIYQNGRYRMDVDDLNEKMADPRVRLMILCSPHNPVGRVWTKKELEQVASAAHRHDVLIVSDEIHGDLVYPGKRQIPFAALSPDAASRSIICTAPSKTFNLAGLQMSNIIIPNPDLRKVYLAQLRRFSLSEPNTLGLVAAEAAYRSGGEWLDQLLDYINGNAGYVNRFLQEKLPVLAMLPLEGTYLGWIDCRKLGLNKSELQNFMVSRARIAVNPGYTFGKEGEGFIRMNLACRRSLVKQAMIQLKRAVDSFRE